MTIIFQSACSWRFVLALIHPVYAIHQFIRPGFQGVFWGVYTALFIAALWIWGKRRSQDGTPTSTFSRLSFQAAHARRSYKELGTSIYRLLRIFVVEIEVGIKPHKRILDAMKWDNMVHIVLVTVMMWLGDLLVIYRTYIVWNRSIRVVALPVIVHIAYMVASTICIHGFGHPDRIPVKIALAWYQPVFPLAFAQNLITTTLLTYKTYSTHQLSRKNGVTSATSGAMGLGKLSWILIETAICNFKYGTASHPCFNQ
ncbi:hypothetical protein BJ165DRAFT_1402830 [Panaeolus papilionaceus]|nr:hypothetical protein BJ165DRAFT_1402830 [Panaeolus papilionaceus]